MDTIAEHSDTRRPGPAWRTAAPVVRAAVAIGTIVALVASVGAPFKWY